MYEPDPPPRIGAEHPCDLFHLMKGWLTTIGMSGTGSNSESNPRVLARQPTTLNDMLLETGSVDDGCVATGKAQGRFSVSPRAPTTWEPLRPARATTGSQSEGCR